MQIDIEHTWIPQRIKADVMVTLRQGIEIRGIKIIGGKSGPFVQWPCHMGVGHLLYHSVTFSSDRKKRRIEDRILRQYQQTRPRSTT